MRHSGKNQGGIGAHTAKSLLKIIRYKYKLTHLHIEKAILNGGELDASLGINQQIINHPPHIIDERKQLSPSAFIPFCEFGGDSYLMGAKIDKFNIPVCNCFKTMVLNDQVCYEVDPSLYMTQLKSLPLKMGLLLVLDYNLDRQMKLLVRGGTISPNKSITSKVIDTFEKNNEVTIYLDTLGKYLYSVN